MIAAGWMMKATITSLYFSYPHIIQAAFALQEASSLKTTAMKLLLCSIVCLMLVTLSCKKEASTKTIAGTWVWTAQFTNNAAYDSSAESTGIVELLSFTPNGNYSVTKNGALVNAGTYKTAMVKSISGQNISELLFSNTRVTDSSVCYALENNGSTLFFSNDLIGTFGSGARYYDRK